MLSKLLKYDLKYMIKSISVFYILSIFFALTTRILGLLNQTVMINILKQISMGCLFSMLANVLINTMMRSWIRFKESIYGDESYLTHTLPVSKNNIYQSKYLITLIYLLIAFIVIIISLFIAFYTKDMWLIITNLIKTISSGINMSTPLLIFTFIFLIFLEIFNGIQSGFLGTILGHKKQNNKIAFSVLFGFITYLLSQTFILIIIFIIGLFNKDIMSLFTSNMIINNDVIKLMTILGIITYIINSLIINIISVKVLQKGINVE